MHLNSWRLRLRRVWVILKGIRIRYMGSVFVLKFWNQRHFSLGCLNAIWVLRAAGVV